VNDPSRPEWGGWGGRFTKAKDLLYRDAQDRVGDVHDARATVWSWRPSFQADFQARLDWGASPRFEDVNHPPTAALNGDRSRTVVEVQARPGETVRLSAEGSTDPDGDDLTARWFVYPEAGTHDGAVELAAADEWTTMLVAPLVTEPRTIHVILEVRDSGNPRLTALRRAVVTVAP
jgi:hypothetical protein